MADDNLSDDQLQQLLKDAEQRLRSKSKTQNKNSEISALSSRYCAPPNYSPEASEASLTITCSIPRIASDKTIESYIKNTKAGPQIDASHLVSEQQRKQANSFRVVEDPITIKKRAEEVWHIFPSIPSPKMSSMRKI